MHRMLLCMGARRYDIAVLHQATGNHAYRYEWSPAQVHKAGGWIAAVNATGSDVLIRPSEPRHPWVLVDTLDRDSLHRLRGIWPPGIVVETWPGKFQAWFRLDEPVDVETRNAIAATMTRRVRAETATIAFGRLPGTTNRTPGQPLTDGRSPFARLRYAGNATIPHTAFQSVRPLPGSGIGRPAIGSSPKASLHQPTSDPSRQDFAIACRLLEAGADNAVITRVITALRGQCPPDLQRTLDSARRQTSPH